MSNYVCEHYSKFDKDCSKLFRKCTSLEDDLQLLKDFIILRLSENGGQVPTNNKYFFHVPGLNAKLPVFKVKSFRCGAINKGSDSGFRVVFAYHRSLSLIYFIEFYYKKNNHTDMNRSRAKEACNLLCNS